MKKTSLILLVLVLSVGIVFGLFACNPNDGNGSEQDSTSPTHPDLDFYQNIISSQEAYLKSLQLENGAFTKWTQGGTSNEVVPYFACFVALALLENPVESNLLAVKNYFDWHVSALNKDGDYNGVEYTIYDYSVSFSQNAGGKTESVLTPKNSYDSTDSYAALFLSALEKYSEVSSDESYAVSHGDEITGVYQAMLSTYSGGLTFAKPDYSIQYLMDNCEVYTGLCAAEKLFGRLGEKAFKDDAAAKKSAVQRSIASMFRTANGLFVPYLGSRPADVNKFYPDMAAQLYPVIFGVLSPTDESAAQVYSAFKSKFGTIEEFDAATDFPWMIIAYGAACYGDYDYAKLLLNFAAENYTSTNAYPWYSMEGATAMLAAEKIYKAINK